MEKVTRVLICGSRSWRNREAIRSWLAKLQDWGYTELIEGGAAGADSIAREEAKLIGFKVTEFKAQWDKFGRAAGPIRNQQMLNEGKPDMVVAFHDDIVHSKGTKDMVSRAEKASIRVVVVSSSSSLISGNHSGTAL